MSVRTLIVDDSLAMQAIIRRRLLADSGIEVVGTAASADEARAQIKALDPDVVTLDIEMPGMSGLDFLERLMRLRPTPVVMLSTLTAQGAEASLTALERGAFDCFDAEEGGEREDFGRDRERLGFQHQHRDRGGQQQPHLHRHRHRPEHRRDDERCPDADHGEQQRPQLWFDGEAEA